MERALTFFICFVCLTGSPGLLWAQPVTVRVGVLGVSAPYGEGYQMAGTGLAAELGARYHLGDRVSVGIGRRAAIHGVSGSRSDLKVSTLFAEGRYGQIPSGTSLKLGDRFYPYIGLRLGYSSREHEVSESLTLVADGPELEPLVGLQQWLSRDVAVELSLGMQLVDFEGEFGGAGVLQSTVILGL